MGRDSLLALWRLGCGSLASLLEPCRLGCRSLASSSSVGRVFRRFRWVKSRWSLNSMRPAPVLRRRASTGIELDSLLPGVMKLASTAAIGLSMSTRFRSSMLPPYLFRSRSLTCSVICLPAAAAVWFTVGEDVGRMPNSRISGPRGSWVSLIAWLLRWLRSLRHERRPSLTASSFGEVFRLSRSSTVTSSSASSCMRSAGSEEIEFIAASVQGLCSCLRGSSGRAVFLA
mmetsp:Transcript_18104/g.42522  ORF Transcript_18104/g.42522 Transcript_18104/m.42522 type:complete len:229 (+) Transcript_18104:103-789(+)